MSASSQADEFIKELLITLEKVPTQNQLNLFLAFVYNK